MTPDPVLLAATAEILAAAQNPHTTADRYEALGRQLADAMTQALATAYERGFQDGQAAERPVSFSDAFHTLELDVAFGRVKIH
jgi:hypothetical protein